MFVLFVLRIARRMVSYLYIIQYAVLCFIVGTHTHTRENMHSPDVLYLYFRKRTAIYTTSLELSQIMQDCIGMNYKDTQDMNFLMTNICGWRWDTCHFLLFFAFDFFVIVFSLLHLLGICCGWLYFKRKYICSEEHTIIYTNTNCCFDFNSILFTERVQKHWQLKMFARILQKGIAMLRHA